MNVHDRMESLTIAAALLAGIPVAGLLTAIAIRTGRSIAGI